MIHYDRLIKQISKDGQIFSLVHNDEYRQYEGEDCPFTVWRDGSRNKNDWEIMQEKVYNVRQFIRLVNNYKKVRLSLGEILDKLHSIDSDKPVLFIDYGKLWGVGKKTLSHRGNYYDLAINTVLREKASTKNELIKLLEEALERKSMTGYKGGDYEINREIDVAMADYGLCGPYIIDVVEKNDYIEFIMENVE